MQLIVCGNRSCGVCERYWVEWDGGSVLLRKATGGETYRLTFRPLACTCPAWRFRKKCKHVHYLGGLTTMSDSETRENLDLMAALAAPFETSEVKWKPQAVNGGRALAIAYTDARVIQDRLDDVLGVAGWQDEYECLADGAVMCRLRVKVHGEWIVKCDVGGQSEQPDEGDRVKAAFSDALKRTAVKFGVGRYLYRLPHQWVDYDAQKKRFVKDPQLPAWARPGYVAPQAQLPAPAAPAAKPGNGHPDHKLPKTGPEFQQRLRVKQEQLVQAHKIPDGALLDHVDQEAKRLGLPQVEQWTADHIRAATDEVTRWMKEKKLS